MNNKYVLDNDYFAWKDLTIINQLLDELGLTKIITKTSGKLATVESLVTIIAEVATKRKRHDVLENLYFAGLC